MKISKIDILVYPCWSGGSYVQNGGIVPSTGVKVTRNKWASLAKRRKWFNYANQIAQDPSRLMFIIHEANGRLKNYFSKEDDFLGKQLDIARYALRTIGERCYFLEDVELGESVKEAREQGLLLRRTIDRGHEISDPVDNRVYGHHRGSCTLKVGKLVLASLELEKTTLTEDKYASVIDQKGLLKEIVRINNPDIYRELTKYEKVPWQEITPNEVSQILYLNGIWEYLFLTKTILQVEHLIRRVSSVSELVGRLGPEVIDRNGRELADFVKKLGSSILQKS